MKHSAARYKRRLKRCLRCSRKTKNKLMESFEHLLNGFLEENPDATSDDLRNAFGPTEEMAATLMEQVEEKDKRAYKLRQLTFRVLMAALACVFILASISMFFWMKKPIYYKDDVVANEYFYIPDVPTGAQ